MDNADFQMVDRHLYRIANAIERQSDIIACALILNNPHQELMLRDAVAEIARIRNQFHNQHTGDK